MNDSECKNSAINRQAALTTVKKMFKSCEGSLETYRDLMSACILDLPEAQPERKKGEWILSPDDSEGVCNVCNYKIHGRFYQGHYLIVPYNYCPNCGADMRGEQDE